MTDTPERIVEISATVWPEASAQHQGDEITYSVERWGVIGLPIQDFALILIARMEEEITQCPSNHHNGFCCEIEVYAGCRVAWRLDMLGAYFRHESRLEATYKAWQAVQEQTR
ncbi:MAG: hypothetical protein ACE5FH_13280 [Candidatus Zixiibacteriota bacterium]